MSTKRILIVSHYYPPHTGGIEIVAYNEATRLAALGNDVTVLTSKTPGDPVSGRYDGVNVIRVPALNVLEPKGIPFPIFAPTLPFKLWRSARHADIVHIHDVFYISSFWAAFVATLLRRPIVITQHVAMVSHPSRCTTFVEKLVYKTTGRWALTRSKRIITVNTRVKRFLIELGVSPNKLISMNNGVDTELFHRPTARERTTARKAFGLPDKAFVVLFIGRFVPKKGFDAMVAASSSEYLTVFAGGETDRQPNENQRFLGRVPQVRLAQLYRVADLFVLPSDSEGFPLTAQEAMATGVPVILKYDTGYGRYNLTKDQVVFLDNADPKKLKKAIVALQHNGTKRQSMIEQAFAYVQQHFSWDHHITELTRLYAGVQGGAS